MWISNAFEEIVIVLFNVLIGNCNWEKLVHNVWILKKNLIPSWLCKTPLILDQWKGKNTK